MNKIKRFAAFLCVLTLLIYGINATDIALALEYNCAAGKHKDVVISRVEPTAVTDGYETVKCELCGREYSAALYATDHLWSDWVVDKQPTCIEKGLHHRTCFRATKHVESEDIPALGHNYVKTETPPECEKDGFITYVCTVCADTYTEPGAPAIGHEYISEITKAPTCVASGVRTFICTHDPSHTYTESVPTVDHTFGEWHAVSGASANKPYITEERKCSICGFTESREIEVQAEPPLFNAVDAAAGGVDIVIILICALLLFGTVRTVRKERRDRAAYKKQLEHDKQEAQKHDFN